MLTMVVGEQLLDLGQSELGEWVPLFFKQRCLSKQKLRVFAGAARTQVEFFVTTDQPHQRSVVAMLQSDCNLLHTESKRLVDFNLNGTRAAVVDDFVGFLGLRNNYKTIFGPGASSIETDFARTNFWESVVYFFIWIVGLGFFAWRNFPNCKHPCSLVELLVHLLILHLWLGDCVGHLMCRYFLTAVSRLED